MSVMSVNLDQGPKPPDVVRRAAVPASNRKCIMALTQRERKAEQLTGPKRIEAPHTQVARRRVPEIAVGLLLAVLAALAAVVLLVDDVQPSSVVAAGVDVPRGGEIQLSDLVAIGVTSDSVLPLNVVPWGQANELVGRTAVVAIPAGTLVNVPMLAEASEIPPDTRAVGMVLTAGPLPQLDLTAGDRVDVVGTAPSGAVMIAESVYVGTSIRSETAREWFVTLYVPTDLAAEVASAAHFDQLRLVRVP